MYQDTPTLETDSFANFSFPQQTDGINQQIPIVDTILPQVPPSDQRAATDFFNAVSTLTDQLQKFQDDIVALHNLLYPSSSIRSRSFPVIDDRSSDRFPSPEVVRLRLVELHELMGKITELAVSSGVAALNSETDANVGPALWVNLGGLGHGGDDQINVNRTFQKMEGMKKSANAVISVLRRPIGPTGS